MRVKGFTEASRRYLAHIALGRCGRCGKNPLRVGSRAVCEVCSDYANKHHAKRREPTVDGSAARCTKCGNRLPALSASLGATSHRKCGPRKPFTRRISRLSELK